MAKKVTKQTRLELVEAVAERYQSGSRSEKRQILGEFVAITGYHRKHAIRLLNAADGPRMPRRAVRPRVYDEAVREALVVLWEASDRVCGKRLKPLLPVLVSALERHGHLQLDPTVRDLVLAASAATIDRVLASTRFAAKGESKRTRRTVPSVRKSVPVRTFADWNEPETGYTEIDLVAHCGGDVSGSFVNTLVVTDVASAWTECVPLLVRDSALVVEALTRLRATLPFQLRGIDTDNGSEFINEVLLGYCKTQGRGSDRGALAVVRRIEALREFLPALFQACRKEACRSSGDQAVPRAADAMFPSVVFGRRDSNHEKAADRGSQWRRPAPAAR
jgi:hypothetical protein